MRLTSRLLLLVLAGWLGWAQADDTKNPWDSKFESARVKTAKKLVSAGRWALKKGIVRDAADLFEKALAFKPDDKTQKYFTEAAAREPGAIDPKDRETWAQKRRDALMDAQKIWKDLIAWCEKREYAPAVAEAQGVLASLKEAAAGPALRRSREETLKFVAAAGASDPDWFAKVPLAVPSGLDLSWPEPSGGWNASANPGQYIWSTVNENPDKWQEGTRVVLHLFEVNKDRDEIRNKALNALGHCYHDLLRDYARAAYYWGKTRLNEGIYTVSYADCFWNLGCPELAAEKLGALRYDSTRYGSAVRLWADMGDLEKARSLMTASGNVGTKRSFGDALRDAGRFAEAATYYKQVIQVPVTGKNHVLVRNKEGAQQMLDALPLFERLTTASLGSGTFTGVAKGYQKDVTVDVALRHGVIRSVTVTKQEEKQHYASLWDIPEKIIAKQSLQDIDTTTGATISAEAIVLAAAKALEKAIQK